MEDIQLSKNFKLSEFTRSAKADQLKVENTPNQEEIDNLTALCVNVLQPLRDKYGRLNISSGFRNDIVNKAVGGVPTSQHRLGQAADTSCQTMNPRAFYKAILNSDLPYDQIILYPNFVHISYGPRHRRANLYAKGVKPLTD